MAIGLLAGGLLNMSNMTLATQRCCSQKSSCNNNNNNNNEKKHKSNAQNLSKDANYTVKQVARMANLSVTRVYGI